MKIIIEIPDKDIPKQQDTMSINFIFTAGCPCQCDYPFDVVKESEDCVSRQAVLDLAKFDGRKNLGSIIHVFDVEQLPPVTPAEKVGQWIPVSERLPSDCGYDWVLAQIQETDTGYLWLPCVAEYRKGTDDWFSEANDIMWLRKHEGAFKVIAWMPLPEPYKASPIGAERSE